jgi:glycosyltransferase involved in cell wall biosynthesis
MAWETPLLGGECRPLYRLRPSDVVEVTFMVAPEFNQTLTVQPDGYITLRDAGAVLAQGLTIPQLGEAVRKAYTGYLHDPEAAVALKDFERPYFVHALQTRYREQHGVEVFDVPNGGALRDRKEPRAILEWGLQPGGYVLFLGRFSPEKGCHLLVEAFEQIETDAKLVMAGASSYCDEYSRELRTHASDRIRMLNWVSGENTRRTAHKCHDFCSAFRSGGAFARAAGCHGRRLVCADE